jgi:C-terminal processing protease CtpA/Prc
MDPAVRAEFDTLAPLSTHLSAAGQLTKADAQTIVAQALLLIEQNYAHLPLKRAMHAIDPVQRLRLLEGRVDTEWDAGLTEATFHAELTEIFTSLRDLHTNYLLPSPFAQITAFLPFIVEDCFIESTCRYLVTHVATGFDHPTFRKGVEIRYWNGMPIERAVRQQGLRYSGSNPAARHARAVQTLTTRALRVSLPPDEEWVVVGYRTLAGLDEEIRVEWLGSQTFSSGVTAESSPASRAGIGIDLQQQLVQRARASLFAPHVRREKDRAQAKQGRGEELGALESSMPHVIQASRVSTASGVFGYIRIRTFGVEPERFLPEFGRLLSALPERGLIIDVRGNGGGYISSGESLLQLFTPRPIEPQPFQFLNSALNLRLCRTNDASSAVTDLSRWTESMDQSLRTGSTFSAGFPVSDVERCNAIGQRYFGPVVLITDALCYSTTDIFAAGFQDHGIGPVIGTDPNTGAGGANVWGHDLLLAASGGPNSKYVPLPTDVGFRVSIRRSLRVGPRAGTPVEDLGVVPDHIQRLTVRDVVQDNADLKDFAAGLLAKMPVRSLKVRVAAATARTARLTISVKRITRIDVYVGTRPTASILVRTPTLSVDVKSDSPADVVALYGFDGDTLVGRRLVPWREILSHAPAAKPPRRGKRKPAKRARTTTAPSTRTPNVGDDAFAASAPTLATLAASALEGDVTPAPAPKWRAAKCLLQLIRQVNARAPQRKKNSDGLIGDAAHQTRASDHNPWVRDGAMGVVTACDITNDPARGCDVNAIAEALRLNKDPRVKYIIWNKRIASPQSIGGAAAWAWRPYGGANPHVKHIHISVRPEKESYDAETAWKL